jgi:hypothetical protein
MRSFDLIVPQVSGDGRDLCEKSRRFYKRLLLINEEKYRVKTRKKACKFERIRV